MPPSPVSAQHAGLAAALPQAHAAPRPVSFCAMDGYTLHGHLWQHASPSMPPRPVVIINPATSVRASYYSRFADFLYRHGFDVLSYDYRGIGASRPPSLRGFEAGWIDWGQLDFEAALGFCATTCASQPVHVVAHSVGGFLIGLAASSHRVERIFTMGAQYAYWRDYARHKRPAMWLKWHAFMPVVTRLCGYFPGQRLGWLEDTPSGVVRDWTAPARRFEDIWRRGGGRLSELERQALVARFAAVRGATLALSLSDDEFGTPAAIQRLLSYYRHSRRVHLHVQPGDIGQASVGHFAFFHSRFESSLWRIPLHWLRNGHLPPEVPGRVLPLAC